MTNAAVRVVAIVVTYHPELARLKLQLGALANQVADIVIVDNASDSDLDAWTQDLAEQSPHVIHKTLEFNGRVNMGRPMYC